MNNKKKDNTTVVIILTVFSVILLLSMNIGSSISAPNNSIGHPVNKIDLMEYVDSNNIDHIDVFNDTENMSELFQPPDTSESGWKAYGAPSISQNSTHYLMLNRVRYGDTSRGESYNLTACPKDKDLTKTSNWFDVWSVKNSEVGPDSVESFEKGNIRKWNSSYYMYFTADISGWDNYYIKSDTVGGFESGLKDSDSWTDLRDNPASSGEKDPSVEYLNGLYVHSYEVTRIGDPSWNVIYKDDNPEFSSPIEVANFTIQGSHASFTTYDERSDKYISAWSNRTASGEKWWYLASDDFNSWSFVEEEMVETESPIYSNSGNARYGDYLSLSNNSYYFFLEFDHDNDDESSTVVWDYTKESKKINTTIEDYDDSSVTVGVTSNFSENVSGYVRYRKADDVSWNSTDEKNISSGETVDFYIDGLNSSTEYEVQAVVNGTEGTILNFTTQTEFEAMSDLLTKMMVYAILPMIVIIAIVKLIFNIMRFTTEDI